MGSPEDSPDWVQSCQTHSGMIVQHSDSSDQEHLLPTTLGRQARDSPRCVPSPWVGNQRLLKREMLGSPSSAQGATPPLS